MVGWMRVDGTRTEYIGLCGDRWQILDIPYADRVRLDEAPIGLLYIPAADPGTGTLGPPRVPYIPGADHEEDETGPDV